MVLILCFDNTEITAYKLKLPFGEDRKVEYQCVGLDFIDFFIFKAPFVIKHLPKAIWLRDYSFLQR
jgi:hypothetical protein